MPLRLKHRLSPWITAILSDFQRPMCNKRPLRALTLAIRLSPTTVTIFGYPECPKGTVSRFVR